MLTTQKPIKQASLWIGKLALFQIPATGWGGWTFVRRPTPPHPPCFGKQRVRVFIDRGRGLQAETAQSALIVSFRLVIGGLTIVILIVVGTVHLQFQGGLFPFL